KHPQVSRVTIRWVLIQVGYAKLHQHGLVFIVLAMPIHLFLISHRDIFLTVCEVANNPLAACCAAILALIPGLKFAAGCYFFPVVWVKAPIAWHHVTPFD